MASNKSADELQAIADFHKTQMQDILESERKKAETKAINDAAKEKEERIASLAAEAESDAKREAEITKKALDEKLAQFKKALVYTPKMATEICSRIASGEMLAAICQDHTMPNIEKAINWLDDPINAVFSRNYSRAMKVRDRVFEDQIVMIADDATNDYVDKKNSKGDTFRVLDQEALSRSKMRIEVRLKIMKANDPRRWGESPNMNVTTQELIRNMNPKVVFNFIEAPKSFIKGDDARVIEHREETIVSRTGVLDAGDEDYIQKRLALLEKTRLAIAKVKVA